MSDWRMDENNELVLVNGDLVLTDKETDHISQNVRQNLRIFKGEWFLDRTLGLPLLSTILEKNPKSNLVATLIKKAILNTKGITKLNTFSMTFDPATRKADVEFSATIVTGEVIYFEESL